jgi:hypothetical protein
MDLVFGSCVSAEIIICTVILKCWHAACQYVYVPIGVIHTGTSRPLGDIVVLQEFLACTKEYVEGTDYMQARLTATARRDLSSVRHL